MLRLSVCLSALSHKNRCCKLFFQWIQTQATTCNEMPRCFVVAVECVWDFFFFFYGFGTLSVSSRTEAVIWLSEFFWVCTTTLFFKWSNRANFTRVERRQAESDERKGSSASVFEVANGNVPNDLTREKCGFLSAAICRGGRKNKCSVLSIAQGSKHYLEKCLPTGDQQNMTCTQL